MSSWHQGDLWMPTAEITDPATELPVDPSTVVMTITTPAKGTQTPTVEHLEEGSFRVKVSLNEPGVWRCVTTSTGVYQASQPATIRVKANSEE